MAKIPANTCIYAVGDIHGRIDLLSQLHKQIAEDTKKYIHFRKILIYLGDAIDRGLHSKAVVEAILHQHVQGFEVVCIKGNHEDFLLQFLSDKNDGKLWFLNGGYSTLASYGVSMHESQLRRKFKHALPPSHKEFFLNLKPYHVEGEYFFCHAGINPALPLSKQKEEDLMWIREPFLESDKDFGKIVVHGHTMFKKPQIKKNRISIDTGAFFSNVLTAVVLVDSKHYFLHT